MTDFPSAAIWWPPLQLLLSITLQAVFFDAAPALSFSLISVHFRHPERLAWFAWCFLFWFALRFYQKTSKDYLEKYWREGAGIAPTKKMREEVIAQARTLFERQFGPLPPNLMFNISNVVLIRGVCYPVSNSPNNVNPFNSRQDVDVKLQGAMLRRHQAFYFSRSLIHGNAFSEYVVPYVLFVIAVGCGLWSFVR